MDNSFPNDEQSTPKHSSSGKRRRSRSLRNGQRRPRQSRHDPIAVYVVVENPDLDSLPDGAGIVRREIVFNNDDVDSAGEANESNVNSPLARADNSRGMNASRTDNLYNMEVVESDESTGLSEIETPQFGNRVDSLSAALATIQECQNSE
jgi:hypothetical protein